MVLALLRSLKPSAVTSDPQMQMNSRSWNLLKDWIIATEQDNHHGPPALAHHLKMNTMSG